MLSCTSGGMAQPDFGELLQSTEQHQIGFEAFPP